MELSKDKEIYYNHHVVSKENQIEKYNNISQLVQKNIKRFSEKPFLGIKLGNSFKFLTYKKVGDVIEKLQNYFKIEAHSELFTSFIFKDKVFPMIGIFTNPRPENLIFMITFNLLRITVLPIFNNIKATDFTNILKHSDVQTLIVDCDCLSFIINKKIFEKKEDKFGLPEIKIKKIILMDLEQNGLTILFKDEVNDYESLEEKFDINNAKLRLSQEGIDIVLLSEILFRDVENIPQSKSGIDGHKNAQDDLDDIILLNYTSKSPYLEDSKQTSEKEYSPKGVLTSERSFISTLNSLLEHKNYRINEEDRYYSLASTADIPEYLHNLLAMTNGILIGYYSGQPGQIFDDLKALQPSILYLYPRVLNKFSEALRSTINKLGDTKKSMVNMAIKIKLNCLLDQGVVDHYIWDKLLFKKIKDTMGGNIRLIIVGGGHLSSDILNFLKVCLNTNITEIYGVTESSGIISISDFDSYGDQFIGNSINSMQIFLKKNNQLGIYTPDLMHHDNLYPIKCGEIHIKGNLFSGYYKSYTCEEATDPDGYFNTGDFGVLYEESITKSLHPHVRFIEKSDEIIMTSAGFLISPNKLEELYSQSEYVSSITIIQDKELNLIAMTVLNQDKILSVWKESNPIADSNENIGYNKRKGSINLYSGNDGSNSLQYKNDKSRRKCAKSIYVKNTNPRLISDYCDKTNTPTHLNSKLSQTQEAFLKGEHCIENGNRNENLKKEILKSFRLIWAENKLKNYESVNHVYILEKDLNPCIENGLLTSKMKLNRDNIRQVYLTNSN